MTQDTHNRTQALGRINARFASGLLACLAILTVAAGIATTTQASALPQPSMPIHLSAEHVGFDALSTGRAAHRLSRSPIRFVGTAEAKQISTHKQVNA